MKFDTSTISGYAEMSAEQQRDALLAVGLPDPVDLSGYVAKKDHDTEINGLHADLKEAMGAEAYAKKYGGEVNEFERKYHELYRQTTIANQKAKYIALGMSEKDAKDAAEALLEKDYDKLNELLAKNNEAVKTAARSGAYKQSPRPNGTDKGGEEEKSLAWQIGHRNAEAAKKAAAVLKHYI